MLWYSRDIDADATHWKRSISPLNRKISIQEIVLLVHAFLGKFEDVSLFIDEGLPVSESIYIVDLVRSRSLDCLKFIYFDAVP